MALEKHDARADGESHGGWRYRIAKEYVLKHPEATIDQVRNATRVSKRTISRVRQDLIKAGQLTPSTFGPQPTGFEVDDSPLEGPSSAIDVLGEQALAAAANTAPLTREQRRQFYSAFAQMPKAPLAARIAALAKLDEGDREQEAKRGLPEPQTTEERIHRVAILCEALEDFDGIEAVCHAFERGTGNLIMTFVPSTRWLRGGVPIPPPPLLERHGSGPLPETKEIADGAPEL